MRFVLALALLSAGGCIDDTTQDGAHLIAHVTSPVTFDQVICTFDTLAPQSFDLPQAATTYDIDHWEVIDPVEDLKVTISLNGNAVATGEASNITYTPQDDGTMYAKILLPLAP